MIRRGIVLALIATALVFSGCASKDEPEPKELEAKVKSEVLEHKGTALGVNQLPVWVETYIAEGVLAVEKLFATRFLLVKFVVDALCVTIFLSIFKISYTVEIISPEIAGDTVYFGNARS